MSTRSRTRLARERRTVQVMIEMYCRAYHDPEAALCPACQQLNDYALQRIARCPFQEDKPTCARCPVHCYRPEMRERIRRVMRYAGPRMLLYHPILAICHVVDGIVSRRKQPPRSKA